jgi:nitroreductase
MSQLNDHQDTATAAESLIRARRSIRAFRPEPVDQKVLDAVFDLARRAPSSSNTQPWTVDVVSGALRDQLSKALIEEDDAGVNSSDFLWVKGDETIQARRFEIGALMYQTLGIERDDKEARREQYLDNLRFFGAPHVALVWVPSDARERVCADAGMYTQTLVLAMRGYGLGSCIQGFIGNHAKAVRETLGSPDEPRKLLYGISFGYPEPDAVINSFVSPRASLEDTVRFLA